MVDPICFEEDLISQKLGCIHPDAGEYYGNDASGFKIHHDSLSILY
jgi:hypothetical protein